MCIRWAKRLYATLPSICGSSHFSGQRKRIADWCGPCRKAAPILEKVAQEYKGKVDVYKIDTQQERELASVFRVKGIPAFLYIPLEGKPTMTSGIGRSNEETKANFEKLIKDILKVTKEEPEV